MEFRKIAAIVRAEVLEKVEQRLQDIGVHGISVTRVKGYGELMNFFEKDWMVSHARVEIFTSEDKVHGLVDAIMDEAHWGEPGDGIIAVLPVEQVYRIHSRSPAAAADL